MTISTTIIKNSFAGNGSTTAFNYSFKITAESEMQVIIRSSTGTETVKTLSSHYTISGVNAANGGAVTFQSGHIPASGETVILRRVTAQTQAMDLIDNDPMSAETIETAHDKTTAIAQELQEQIDRSLKLSRTNTMTSTEFTVDATNRANKVLAFDSAGEIAVTQELGTYKGNWAASTAYAVRDLVKDTSTNNIFICLTAHTSSGSQPLTTNTDSAKWSLIVDAASASTSATAAASSATASANSATASASSASTASGHKDTATTKASEAASSATAAASSATTSATQATNSANSATASANSATASASSATAAANSATQAAASANFEVVGDTTPQLGGNLDTNDKEIVTVSNRDLVLAANGTGAVEIKGNTNSAKLLFNCEANTHHVSLEAPAHSAFGGNIALTLPTSVGSSGQAMVTNGSGVLSFATIAETKPTVADVSQTIAPATATTINITGTGFVSIPSVTFVNSSTGAITNANTISFTNATTLSVNVTLASGNYFVRVENPNGLAGRSTNNILTASTAPTFSTNAGSLGTIAGNFSGTVATVAGSSDSTIAFSETTSVLTNASQANCTLNSSTGVITTSDFGGSSTSPTLYQFTLKITDAEGQFVTRDFSLQSSFGATGGAQFN